MSVRDVIRESRNQLRSFINFGRNKILLKVFR